MSKLPSFYQVSKLVLFLIFALFTLFIPAYLRHPYLYFLFNIVVVALGVESGLLKAVTSPHDQDKRHNSTTHFQNVRTTQTLQPSIYNGTNNVLTKTKSIAAIATQALAKPIEKVNVETALAGIVPVNKIKKCASRPSLFFIGGLESEQEYKKESNQEEEIIEKEEEWMEADLEMTKQELFAKAENFIGNFYRQLKMQREESWRKIHGLYHKAL